MKSGKDLLDGLVVLGLYGIFSILFSPFMLWVWAGISWAEPSWGISIFELKSSCQFFWCIAFWAQNFFSCFYQCLNQKFKKKKYCSLKRKLKIELTKCKGNKEKKYENKKCQFSNFWAEIKFRAEGKRSWGKASRAKLKILQLKLWLEPAWLELITIIYH